MSQVTIRDLPPAVEAHLREKARIEGRSLSKVASDLLAEASGLGGGDKKRNLAHFSGSWSAEDAAAFEATQKIFGAVDVELWE
jgi:plasmid stability protein